MRLSEGKSEAWCIQNEGAGVYAVDGGDSGQRAGIATDNSCATGWAGLRRVVFKGVLCFSVVRQRPDHAIGWVIGDYYSSHGT